MLNEEEPWRLIVTEIEERDRIEALNYWRLCDELSIVQASLLIVGRDPAKDGSLVERWDMHKRPMGYEAAKASLTNALRRGAIKGRVNPQVEYDVNSEQLDVIEDSVDLDRSRVEVESLRAWLLSRGFRTGFFFPNAVDSPDYLDPINPRYAPKLAAAVRAWQAVTEPGGKHPKQALMKWLREHAAEFWLTDEEGKPNETGIEEAAKVANWQPGGGAPKTPGQ